VIKSIPVIDVGIRGIQDKRMHPRTVRIAKVHIGISHEYEVKRPRHVMLTPQAWGRGMVTGTTRKGKEV